MRRFFLLAMMASLIVIASIRSDRSDARPQQWGTIKGQVVWAGAAIPNRKEIKVLGPNAAQVLKINPTANAVKGTILDEDLLTNAKNNGIKTASQSQSRLASTTWAICRWVIKEASGVQ